MMNFQNTLTTCTVLALCVGFTNAACNKGAVTGACLGGALTQIVMTVLFTFLCLCCCIKQGRYTEAGVKSYYNRMVVKVTFGVAFVLSVLTSILVGYFALAQDNNCWNAGGAYGLGVGIASGCLLIYHFGAGCARYDRPNDGEKGNMDGQCNPAHEKERSNY